MRDGRRHDVQVKLAERPPRDDADRGARSPTPASRSPRAGGAMPRSASRCAISIATSPAALEVPDAVQGVIVARVDPMGAGILGADIGAAS